MCPIQDDVLAEYLAECSEKLERLGVHLAKLEAGAAEAETWRALARDVHTIKGSSQLFAFKLTAQTCHALEDCLERLKGAGNEIVPSLVPVCYGALELIRSLSVGIKTNKSEPPLDSDVSTLIARLEAIVKPEGKALPSADIRTETPRESKSEGEPPVTSKPASRMEDGPADTIRVNVALLDSLMNQVGELVLVRNQLLQAAKGQVSEEIFRIGQRLNVVTGELQNDVMKTRMQPIGNLFGKFQRIVRDLATEVGKRIDLELVGNETELDKTLIEAVRDPLMHLVRNAVDHGFETPAERKAAGKSETARLKLRALHESGQVIVEIIDDGRGLDRDRIGAKAVERGLLTPDALSRLSDRDIYQLIFTPGFSTAEKLSSLSGRGVGMDVVKTNIERMGGAVELATQRGQGTTITLRIPLTLAIIPALLVSAGGERFAIPQIKLVELLCVASDKGLEFFQGQPVYRLRGQLLPLVSLNDVLGLGQSPAKDVINIAVLMAEKQVFGLIVDEIEDSADIVVKPMANFIKDIGVYAGATILGDGAVALTIDVFGLAQLAKLGGTTLEQTSESAALSSLASRALEQSNEAIEYLLVDLTQTTPLTNARYAIPLCVVQRLEEFATTELRFAAKRRVIPYRNALLPIINASETLRLQPPGHAVQKDHLAVVVVKHNERLYGLQVEAINDIVFSSAKLDSEVCDRDGLLGSFIDGGQVITVIDAMRLIALDTGLSSHGKPPVADDFSVRRTKHLILLIDDSAFFRKQGAQQLENAGYRVTAIADAAEAVASLAGAQPGTFAAVVSDVDRRHHGGLEIARAVRGDPRLQGLPLVALTIQVNDHDRQVGLKEGFDRYLAKLKPGELIEHLDALLGIAQEIKHAS